MYLPYSTNLTSYCTAPSPLHTYMYLSACLPVCATPLRATLYCTPPVRVPLPTVCCGDPHGESHQVLLWSGTSAGTHTHTHTTSRVFQRWDRTEKQLLLHRLICTYLLVGTYMLSIVEPPSTTPFITSFPSPHRAARRADGRHSTRKPSTTTPVRLVHLSHRWSGRPAIRRYAHIIMG